MSWALQPPREILGCLLLLGGHAWASLKTWSGLFAKVYCRLTKENSVMAFIFSEARAKHEEIDSGAGGNAEYYGLFVTCVFLP